MENKMTKIKANVSIAETHEGDFTQYTVWVTVEDGLALYLLLSKQSYDFLMKAKVE